tara:strand:- start:782 stop:970 length:189 start_codon:yes stop_codon:yes gene_type:complete
MDIDTDSRHGEDPITITVAFHIACAIQSALDMALSGVKITDYGHKRRIAAASDAITDAILYG